MTSPKKGKLPSPKPETERRYLELLLHPLDACATYKPKFGTSTRKELVSTNSKPSMVATHFIIGSGWILISCMQPTKLLAE
jgi:hypothetical protein